MAPPHALGVAPPDYHLPDATRVGGVHLQVSNLAQSHAYYTDVLGLRVISQGDDHLALAATADDEVLVELHHRPGTRPVPRGGLLGLYHFAILLPSRAALGRFVTHLERRGVPLGSADHLVSEAIYLWDPDGLGIEVYADRPRDAWRHNGRELVMTTEPLDRRSLVAAGGTRPWTGMPVGTTMGHVHLSVGDLTAARALYHAALGFDAMVWSYPGALFLSAGGYHHHLGTNTWAAGARAPGDHDARLLEWTLVLPESRDVQRAALSLQNAGYDIDAAGADRVVVDPWGTALRLTNLGARRLRAARSSA